VWGPLFIPVVKRAIRKPPPPGKKVWWLPPDHMDQRATGVLSWLCLFSVLAGFLGVLIGQLNPYFQDEFVATNSDISHVLIAVRIAGFSALAVVALADRRGRKAMLMFSSYAAIAAAFVGAFSPSLVALGVTQTVGRTFSAAIALLIGIMAAEEMPAGARAFAVSMMIAAGALGAGGVVAFLFIADLQPWAWRGFFVVPLIAIIPVHLVGKRLPESRRFEVYELRQEQQAAAAGTEPAPPAAELAAIDAVLGEEPHPEANPERAAAAAVAFDPGGRMNRSLWFRFGVLATSAFMLNVFITPAGQLFNQFLKNERGYSGFQITMLQIITNVPGGLSMLIGGRLAESRGRRVIGAIGTAGGAGFTVLMFLSSGAGIWVFSTLGTLIGAIAVPALGVYGAELFPTGSRGLASGGLNLFAVFGAVAGLEIAGVLSEPGYYGGLGPPMALLGIGPLIVVILVMTLYPETAHRELEDINPTDAAPPRTDETLEELDETWDAVHHHGAGDPAA
jgi:MFS family permease